VKVLLCCKTRFQYYLTKNLTI